MSPTVYLRIASNAWAQAHVCLRVAEKAHRSHGVQLSLKCASLCPRCFPVGIYPEDFCRYFHKESSSRCVLSSKIKDGKMWDLSGEACLVQVIIWIFFIETCINEYVIDDNI